MSGVVLGDIALRYQQSGVMLLEALIAILIFSLGILGVVAMQASAVAASRDAQYRSVASQLADELIGQMWSGNRDGAALEANFKGSAGFVSSFAADNASFCSDRPGTDGFFYCRWFNTRVLAMGDQHSGLPGVRANPPVVVVTPGLPAGNISVPQTSSTVSVTIRWMSPNDTVAHSYRVVVQII